MHFTEGLKLQFFQNDIWKHTELDLSHALTAEDCQSLSEMSDFTPHTCYDANLTYWWFNVLFAD